MTFDFGNNQLIMLSASANKLSRLKERAEEYASLIMEELDPENFGYIEVRNGHNCSLVFFLLLNTPVCCSYFWDCFFQISSFQLLGLISPFLSSPNNIFVYTIATKHIKYMTRIVN